MKRSPIKRKTRLLSKTRPKRKKRAKAEFRRIYGSKQRVVWVQSQPCAVCGRVGASQNAHVITGGMGRKAGAEFIAPLCWVLGTTSCHVMLHLVGVETFQQMYRVDLLALAAQTEAAWQAYTLQRRTA